MTNPRAMIGDIPVFCAYDEIIPTANANLHIPAGLRLQRKPRQICMRYECAAPHDGSHSQSNTQSMV
jgi:hypothetical protein